MRHPRRPPPSINVNDLTTFKKAAFTLAELLITLAIIGVVAALTIPTLMHSYKKKLIETRLRIATITINNLIKRLEADEGEITNWNYWSIEGDQTNRQRTFAQNTLMNYLPNAMLCDNKELRVCSYKKVVDGKEKEAFTNYNKQVNKIVLPNGIGFWLDMSRNLDKNSIRQGYVYIDLNISKDKIYNGVDFFLFTLVRGPQNNTFITSISDKGFDWSGWNPYLPKCGATQKDKDGNTLTDIQLCQNPDLDNYYGYPQAYCSVMIECNDWKIPDTYPIKF